MENLSQIKANYFALLDNPDANAQVVGGQDFLLLVVPSIHLENAQLEHRAHKFLLTDNAVYRYHDLDGDFESIDGYDDLTVRLSHIINDYDDIIDGFISMIGAMEHQIFTEDVNRQFLKDWFSMKKDLAYIEQLLIRVDHAFNHLKKLPNVFSQAPALQEEFANQCKDTQFCLGKLDTMYNYYDSLKNEKMNDQIYWLTVISAVFLPINFIVGFFGINTQGLFFNQDPHGTWYVIYLIFASLVAVLLLVPITKGIVKIINMRFLDRFKFYHKLHDFMQRNQRRAITKTSVAFNEYERLKSQEKSDHKDK